MKQKFKGKMLTRTKVVNNIMRFYNHATPREEWDGITWYDKANQLANTLSLEFGIPARRIAGVIAALSPQTSWELNKIYVNRFLLDGVNAIANTMAMKMKAEACLKANTPHETWHILNGNKIQRFFMNIYSPHDDGFVTVDRHAIAVCIQSPSKTSALDDNQSNMTDDQYKFFEECYRVAANKVGIKAHEMQAITWVTYRRLRNLK